MTRRDVKGRVARAFAVLLAVLACQLVPPFIYNTYGPGVAIATVVVLLACARFVDARVVGVTALAIAFASWCVAEQSVQRELRVWEGSSDLEDGLVMLAFGVGSLGGIALATWIGGRAATKVVVLSLAGVHALVTTLVALAIVMHFVRPRPLNHGADVATAIAGLALGVGYALLAWRAQRATAARLATATSGRHAGDGWVELDDGKLHHPPLAARPPGPVVVHGAKLAPTAGYRDGATGSADAVDEGTIDEVRARGRARLAGRLAVGAAVVVMGALKVLSVGRFGAGVFFGGAPPTRLDRLR
ncbi:MAG: hypothetical protein KIT84_27575 [Labilithrix sp.]|nr:hypothetical protein [Labilithrix sp.]MCW5814819.1 hypothetical protein [Labilithrix sp.]